ncbi:WAT1-related protein At4g28040 [Linum perenne]
MLAKLCSARLFSLVELGSLLLYLFFIDKPLQLCSLLLSFISTRKDPTRVSLTLKSFSWIFAASLIGVTANMNAYFEGINLASSTAATAISNLIPALTFLIAAILGMEKINSISIRSGAKIVGTIICVVGAMAIAFQEGPKLLNSDVNNNSNNWLMGCLLLFACSFCWSLWIILQVI